MVPRKDREGSEPTLEVSSLGVVDGSGHYLEHAAVVPQKARVVADGECAVIVRPESASDDSVLCSSGQSGSDVSGSDREAVQESSSEILAPDALMTDEVTAITKVPRRASSRGILRALAYVEAHRSTVLILAIGVVLVLFTLGLWLGL